MGKGPAATAGIERSQSSSRKAWPPGRMARRSAAYQLFLTRLREARIAAWLVQAGLAARLRRPQSYLSKCESGERRVNMTRANERSDSPSYPGAPIRRWCDGWTLAGNQGRKVPNENTVGFTESEVNVVKDVPHYVPHYDVNGQAVASRKDRGEACRLGGMWRD